MCLFILAQANFKTAFNSRSIVEESFQIKVLIRHLNFVLIP